MAELSVHMISAIGFGLAFFVSQIACLILYHRSLRAESRSLADIADPARPAASASAESNSPWIRWVVEHFPEGVKRHGNFTRDDAFQELDWRLSTRLPLAILHRLGVIAPLLGVIITAVGFFGVRMPSAEESVASDLFRTIQPVVVGVLIGGLLSIVNQVLLQVAESSSDGIREQARGWFDDCVWPRVVTREESTNRQAAASLERTAATMSEFARKHNIAAHAATDATQVIDRSADLIRQAVRAVSTEWQSSVRILAETGQAVERATEQFRRLLPDGVRLADRMVNSVDRFGEIVEARFAERVRLQQQAASQLAESAGMLETVVTSLQVGTRGLIDFGATLKGTGEGFLETFKEAVVPGQGRLVATAADISANVDSLKDRIGLLDGALRASAEAIAEVAPDFRRVFTLVETTTDQFRSVVEGDLATAARRHKETVDDWSGAARATDRVVHDLREATEPLGGLLDDLRQSGERLRESVEGDLKPAGRQLLGATTQLAASAAGMGASINTIDQSLDRTTQEFSKLSERATQALDQLSPSIDQFRGLVLDQLAPAAQKQRAAAESAASALHQVHDSTRTLAEATASIRDLVARQLNEAEVAKQSAEALRAATDWLKKAGDTVKGVLADDLPPLEVAIRDAVNHFRQANDGLNGIVQHGAERVNRQFQVVEGSLSRIHDLVEGLRPMATSGPEVAGMLRALDGQFDRLTGGVTDLAGRISELSGHLQGRRRLFGG